MSELRKELAKLDGLIQKLDKSIGKAANPNKSKLQRLFGEYQ
jgi:hypothetical protein